MARPSKYKNEMAKQAQKLCEFGATDAEIASFFEVDVRTVYRWQTQYKEFCQALKVGKEAADARVERSLFHKANGYSHPEDKIFQYEGTPIVVPTTKHYPPDTTAAIFWLKNRKPEEWRDKVQQEHTGADGGPLEVSWLPSEK